MVSSSLSEADNRIQQQQQHRQSGAAAQQHKAAPAVSASLSSFESSTQKPTGSDQPQTESRKPSTEPQELLPFSFFRCFWNANLASDPLRCQGYLEVSATLQSLTFQCEVPGKQQLQPQASEQHRPSITGVGEKTLEIARRNAALECLFPVMCVVVTVGRRIAFRSTKISLRTEMADELEKSSKQQQRKTSQTGSRRRSSPTRQQQTDNADNDNEWITVGKPLYNDKAVHSDAKDDNLYRVTFAVYHPHDIVGFHLISVDQTADCTVDEILASRFIQACQLSKQPRTPQLSFNFRFPLSNLSGSHNALSKHSRECHASLFVELNYFYASPFRSLPALALDPPFFAPPAIFSSGPDTPVRLLATEFLSPIKVNLESGEVRQMFRSYTDTQEDIQTTMKHAQLFIDILMFWVLLCQSTIQSILSWNNPMRSVLVTAYVSALVVLPSLSYPLLILAVALVLFSTHGVDDNLTPRFIELYSTSLRARAKVETVKTTFSSEGEKKEGAKGEGAPAAKAPTATTALITSLTQSALPVEVIELIAWLRPLLASWLPVAVYVHCVLVWNPSAIDHWWRMKCYLNHMECEAEDINNKTDISKQSNKSDASTDAHLAAGSDEADKTKVGIPTPKVGIPTSKVGIPTAKEGCWRVDPYYNVDTPKLIALRRHLPMPSGSLLLLVVCVVGSFWCFIFADRVMYLMVTINWFWFSYLLVKYSPLVIALKRSIRAFSQWLFL